MNHLFDMSMPWWAFALRAIAVYAVLMVYLRLADKRTLGEMATFDIVVLVVLSSSVRTAIMGDDTSFVAPLIAVAAILLVDKLLASARVRWPWLDRLLESRPSVIARDGRRDNSALRRHDISRSLFERELRLAGMENEGDVVIARLEGNGKISWIRRKAPRK
ncbi:DUF421 domain-containing protein [Dyella sp.]|jgi:uncharacterized membrane protein YcaP (DUF421 family)|uniref:DUF421 domain-containing protein n=1 Tax=Dyella sp. TaxID=1869338 RepID=UPI002D767415|nr:YetF domain-containing protein [Dyella sp.]HET6433094.1 YetF domain-containing protein [Dyella sp.]